MRARSSIARRLPSSAGAILLGLASACASETTHRPYPDLPPVEPARGELEGSARGETFGFEAVKRQLAYQLGVDPYSSNKRLQRQLNRFAWASYAGGLPGKLVPFRKGASAADTPEPTLLQAGERLDEILRHFSPEDLDRLNRIELGELGFRLTENAFEHLKWSHPETARGDEREPGP